MRQKIWLVFIFFCLTALPLNLRAQTCICYDTAGDCSEVTVDDADGDGELTDSDCDEVCQSNLRDDYANFQFSDEPEEEADLSQTCEEEVETAETEATTAAAASSTTTSRPSLTPLLNVDIPGVSFSQVLEENGYVEVNFLAEYISGIYKYLLAISAIFAVLMIMIGGIEYIIGRGGKERIYNAGIGIILLFSVYLILYTVNPSTTIFDALRLTQIPELPYESAVVTYGSGVDAGTGNFYGVGKLQDCYLNTYGSSKTEIEKKLVYVKYGRREYRVHELVAKNFAAALEEINASGTNYDITTSMSGGTYAWRANVNKPTYLSTHSFGIAIDINPEQNPNCPNTCATGGGCSCVGGNNCESMCRSGRYDLPQEVIDAFKNNGFTWGGDWRSVKDYMHFHYKGHCGG